jgi:hypothetical protein
VEGVKSEYSDLENIEYDSSYSVFLFSLDDLDDLDDLDAK